MRVSVIIPTYNYGRFIGEAIDSVLRQTVPVFEILVIDDGSTDETTEVLNRITDPRLRVTRTPNSGVSAARNVGLSQFRGDVISFLDADDRWFPMKIESELRLLQSEPGIGAIFSNFVRFNEERTFPAPQFQFFPELSSLPTRPAACGLGRCVDGDPFTLLVAFGELPTWAGTTTFRADIVRDLRFDPQLRICEDVHFCLRAFLRTGVAFFDTPFIEVRRHDTNSTKRISVIPRAQLEALQRLEEETMHPQQREALRARIARALISAGRVAAREGHRGEALSSYFQALRYGARRRSVAKQVCLLSYDLVSRSLR